MCWTGVHTVHYSLEVWSPTSPHAKKNNRERKKTTHTHPCLTEIRNARTCLEFNRAKMFFNRLSNATYLSNLYLNLNPPFKTCCLAAHVPGTHAPQTRWGKKMRISWTGKRHFLQSFLSLTLTFRSAASGSLQRPLLTLTGTF